MRPFRSLQHTKQRHYSYLPAALYLFHCVAGEAEADFCANQDRSFDLVVQQHVTADAFIDQAAWGTPAQVIEKIQARRDVIGDYSVMLSPTWGGMPYDLAHASMKLVSEKVLPELRTIGA